MLYAAIAVDKDEIGISIYFSRTLDAKSLLILLFYYKRFLNFWQHRDNSFSRLSFWGVYSKAHSIIMAFVIIDKCMVNVNRSRIKVYTQPVRYEP